MYRTLGAAPATLLSLRERLIEFAFGSFHLRYSDKPHFLWQVAFPQFFELLPQVKIRCMWRAERGMHAGTPK